MTVTRSSGFLKSRVPASNCCGKRPADVQVSAGEATPSHPHRLVLDNPGRRKPSATRRQVTGLFVLCLWFMALSADGIAGFSTVVLSITEQLAWITTRVPGSAEHLPVRSG